jgi:3-hydroxyisobutyrate dehydrogenase-like beta-hydroxyacid dehydrogenase
MQSRLAHYLEVADKDLGIALELARDLGVDLPVTSLCAEGIAEVYGQTTPRQR